MRKLLPNEYRTAKELRAAYYPGHEYCALCGIPTTKGRLELAHIFGGASRRHVPANVVMLCARCHSHQHRAGHREMGERLPSITPALLIVCKRALGELDTEALAEVTGWTEVYIQQLADETKMPEVYAHEWAEWREK